MVDCPARSSVLFIRALAQLTGCARRNAETSSATVVISSQGEGALKDCRPTNGGYSGELTVPSRLEVEETRSYSLPRTLAGPELSDRIEVFPPQFRSLYSSSLLTRYFVAPHQSWLCPIDDGAAVVGKSHLVWMLWDGAEGSDLHPPVIFDCNVHGHLPGLSVVGAVALDVGNVNRFAGVAVAGVGAQIDVARKRITQFQKRRLPHGQLWFPRTKPRLWQLPDRETHDGAYALFRRRSGVHSAGQVH